jgi:hypothetical protein
LGDDNSTPNFVEKPEEKKKLVNLDVNEKIILKWILKTQDERM